LYKQAIADLDTQLEPNHGATATATKYKLDRTTLSRRAQGKQWLRAIANLIYQQCLTLIEEVSLIDYINKLTVQGLPPMALIVRNLADEIIRHSVRKNWTGQFMKHYTEESLFS
jgi:hypothetical protein